MVVVVEIVNDRCHAGRVNEPRAPRSHGGMQDVLRAIEVDTFNAFPVFVFRTVAELPPWNDASSVDYQIRMIITECGIDAFLVADVGVYELVEPLI